MAQGTGDRHKGFAPRGFPRVLYRMGAGSCRHALAGSARAELLQGAFKLKQLRLELLFLHEQ